MITTLKVKMTSKMRATSRMKLASEMKMTSKIKTASKMKTTAKLNTTLTSTKFVQKLRELNKGKHMCLILNEYIDYFDNSYFLNLALEHIVPYRTLQDKAINHTEPYQTMVAPYGTMPDCTGQYRTLQNQANTKGTIRHQMLP